ncbi:hypothetical protein [Psychrobacter sanguinis]|uniref:hypothetical protein n=1 Tax=Psychrobacter sanguinis TaxID=861445 RepID=UPI00191A055D|nr:hypothetical protein [Psychrobacter sanguinis]UEC26007.1 hypothetical protein LK453_02395 [Psychrobacter sanguinis]
MNSIPFLLEQKIHQVIIQKISLKDFEQWLYQNDELEVLNPNLYLELISFDYSHESSFKEFQISFAKFVDRYKFEVERIKDYLCSIIDRDENCAKSILMTYELYCMGYEFLQKLGLKYGLCLIDTSYPVELVKDSNDVIDMFYPDVISDAENVLGWFKEGKIIFREEKNERGGFEYDDLRTEEEKQQGKF